MAATHALTGPGPTSHTYYSQRLRLHYVDWGNEDAEPLLLIHGGRDHCRNWDWVAQSFRDTHHIIAPDLRGHGDSQWMIGGTYDLSHYVYDIAQLIHQKQLNPVTIIAHSMGGSVAVRYAGLYPETVKKLVVIEGLGPSPKMIEERLQTPLHERTTQWVDQMRKLSSRQPRRYESILDAFTRMQGENPHLSPEQARHLTVHGVSQNEDGTYSWKFDNYMRAFSPTGFSTEESQYFWSRITCPTLLIRGAESWASDPLLDGRADHFQNAKAVNIENAGHWVHHDQLDIFLDLVKGFFED